MAQNASTKAEDTLTNHPIVSGVSDITTQGERIATKSEKGFATARDILRPFHPQSFFPEHSIQSEDTKMSHRPKRLQPRDGEIG